MKMEPIMMEFILPSVIAVMIVLGIVVGRGYASQHASKTFNATTFLTNNPPTYPNNNTAQVGRPTNFFGDGGEDKAVAEYMAKQGYPVLQEETYLHWTFRKK